MVHVQIPHVGTPTVAISAQLVGGLHTLVDQTLASSLQCKQGEGRYCALVGETAWAPFTILDQRSPEKHW